MSLRVFEVKLTQDVLVAGQHLEIPHRAQVGLDGPILILDGGLLDVQIGAGLSLDRRLVSKAIALGLPSFVVSGAELGGCGEAAAWASMPAAVWGVLVLGASAALRICDPSVPASPADRYSKGVAETENKAKKKLVSHKQRRLQCDASLMAGPFRARPR